MAFKTLFLAHAPDADKEKHHCFIDTGKYQLDVVVVKNLAEALEVCTRLFREKKIESILSIISKERNVSVDRDVTELLQFQSSPSN
jgi:hypothetical protein